MVSVVFVFIALIGAPLLPGVANQVKAWFAGRQGPPLVQLYRDLWRLMRKGAVYSRTTTWVFRLGPVVGLSAALLALVMTPLGGVPAVLAFRGDFLFLLYCLALLRFLTVLAALDTGSSFEGMGASREVQFSALAEPALLLALAALARQSGSLELSAMLGRITPTAWTVEGPALAMAAAALLVVFLTENARIPIDDPNTHLELTMIHEVMVLDHSGPDFAAILYTASLKLWILGALLVGILVPYRSGSVWLDGLAALAGMLIMAAALGVIESVMGRLRLLRVPHLLAAADVLSGLSFVLVMR